MALGQTNITTAMIRNIISAAVNKVTLLCGHANINKWSRKKPVRGTFPQSADGKYGINPASSWGYLRPRGLANNEPYRMGDFRGYEHNKDIATPIVYADAVEISVPATITPNVTGSGCAGTFTMSCNTAHNDVRILPSEVGIGSYYWGLRLGGYYKTFGVITDGTVMQFILSLDLSDPQNPAFTGLPMMDAGTITWRLFICSTEQTSWSATQPSNYIELPGGSGEQCGSRIIKSTGTFVLNNWIVTDLTSLGWLHDEGTYTNYLSLYVICSADNWHLAQKPTGFGIKDGGGADISVETGTYASGTEVRLYPLVNNQTQEPLAGIFIFHDSSHTPVEVEVLQTAYPEPIAVSVVDGQGNSNITIYEGAGTVAWRDTDIELVVVGAMDGYSEGQQFQCPYSITVNGSPAGSGNITLESSQSAPTEPFPIVIMSGFQAETDDVIIVTLN